MLSDRGGAQQEPMTELKHKSTQLQDDFTIFPVSHKFIWSDKHLHLQKRESLKSGKIPGNVQIKQNIDFFALIFVSNSNLKRKKKKSQ